MTDAEIHQYISISKCRSINLTSVCSRDPRVITFIKVCIFLRMFLIKQKLYILSPRSIFNALKYKKKSLQEDV